MDAQQELEVSVLFPCNRSDLARPRTVGRTDRSPSGASSVDLKEGHMAKTATEPKKQKARCSAEACRRN